MILTFELGLILLSVILLGVWGIVSGVLQSRQKKLEDPVSPQQLSRLAQPYRELMGEAVSIYKDVANHAETANEALRPELHSLLLRVALLLKLAYPKAEHGTNLKAYALQLQADDEQQTSLESRAQETALELQDFLRQLKTLRSKLYQLLSDASRLSADLPLKQDLDETFAELAELETRLKMPDLEKYPIPEKMETR